MIRCKRDVETRTKGFETVKPRIEESLKWPFLQSVSPDLKELLDGVFVGVTEAVHVSQDDLV